MLSSGHQSIAGVFGAATINFRVKKIENFHSLMKYQSFDKYELTFKIQIKVRISIEIVAKAPTIAKMYFWARFLLRKAMLLASKSPYQAYGALDKSPAAPVGAHTLSPFCLTCVVLLSGLSQKTLRYRDGSKGA